MRQLLVAGLLVLGIAAALAIAVADGGAAPAARALAPAVPAVLVAVPAVAVAIATGLIRIWAYLAILASAAVVTVAYGLEPGWPLAVSGLAVLLGGAWLLVGFLRTNPRQVVDG